MTVTEFLLARIAEDEAVVQAAAWVPDPDDPDDDYDNPWAKDHGEFASRGGAKFTHILRNDPSRVLAECAAKRAIVELAGLIHDKITWEWGGCDSWKEDGWVEDNEGTELIRTLAAVYASHPDYDETWKP